MKKSANSVDKSKRPYYNVKDEQRRSLKDTHVVPFNERLFCLLLRKNESMALLDDWAEERNDGAMAKTAYLKLANGMVLRGECFGAEEEIVGEVVFTTAMTGYLETITDPSYYGQIVIQSFPLIGNYGVISADFESKKPWLKGYIVRELCEHPSNFRSEGDLNSYLKAQGISGISGIDTRALTRIVREYGVMNGKISLSAEYTEEEKAEICRYSVTDAVKKVSIGEVRVALPEHPMRRVVLWDFGAKANIERELLKRNCEVITVPYDTSAEEILSYHPHGIMLSNGPGDPSENIALIAQLKTLCEAKIPTFGICLGHQLLALSQGAQTEKLKYGHRGANQPVLRHEDGHIYVTAQNHGYAVRTDTLPLTAQLSYSNVNDGSCEGIRYLNMPAFSVQFHPEASAGPQDTAFLFDEFTVIIDNHKALCQGE